MYIETLYMEIDHIVILKNMSFSLFYSASFFEAILRDLMNIHKSTNLTLIASK